MSDREYRGNHGAAGNTVGILVNSLRLAVSLLRIPRLFGALFLFPLLISIVVVTGQIIFTALMLKSLDTVAAPVEDLVEQTKDHNVGRILLYGHGRPLPPVEVCRWIEHGESERPPNAACAPGRLDVALRTLTPATFDVEQYRRAFEGNVERLHVCRSCRPDVVITPTGTGVSSDIYSLWGLVVVNLVRFNRNSYLEGLKQIEQVAETFGQRTLHLSGLAEAINLNRAYTHLAITINFAGLIIVALWLALKAHRKVLDYFARSGALLPLVAATGHRTFYGAIWLLTLCRVGAFLGAALPMTYVGFVALLTDQDRAEFFSGERTFVWLATVTASLGLATLIASIAELKHRHSLLSFLYKYVPVIICFIGGAIWAFTFFFDSTVAHTIRAVATATPLIGMAPVLLGPVLKPATLTLMVHCGLSVAALMVALRHNSRWFAAHLEEI